VTQDTGQTHVYAPGPIDFWSAWKRSDEFLADTEQDVTNASWLLRVRMRITPPL
jgi:hypothetical protein